MKGLKIIPAEPCSICGRRPAVNIEGTYWMCGECVNEKFEDYVKAFDLIQCVIDRWK
jgi:hypothetical protein